MMRRIEWFREVWHLLPLTIRSALANFVETAYSYYLHFSDSLFDHLYRVETTQIRSFTDTERMRTIGKDPTRSVPTHYLRAFALRRYLEPAADDVFVDLGCGSGRVLFVFARMQLRIIKGVDFDTAACETARKNAQRFRGRRSPISIEQGDCATFKFSEETIVFLYNPFGTQTLRAVLDNLHDSFTTNPRKLRICFFSAPTRLLLDQMPWLELEHEVRFLKKGFLIYRTLDLEKLKFSSTN